MNPAVTLAFLRLRKIHPWDASFFVIAQVIGGTLGVSLVAAIARSLFSSPPVSYTVTVPGARGAAVAIPMTVQAMKAGAIEFMTKPFNPAALRSALSNAVERSRKWIVEDESLKALTDRHESLSRREREVMWRVVRGQLNKQVGGELGISEITVKAHRGKMMRKMQAKSVADLVRMASRLKGSQE